MTDRPIIFSAPMVRALLDGRKTQTRRLATSPLRRCEVGDRLYVREAWRTHSVSDELSPRMLTGEGRVWFEADRDNCDQHGRLRPGMHMPRWASRLTLIVEAVRFEPLQAISETDARAEGVTFLEPTDADREWAKANALENGGDGSIEGVWIVPGIDCGWGEKPRGHMWGPTPASMFRFLWNSLHTKPGERWENNPDLVALTFRVERGNIDRMPA